MGTMIKKQGNITLIPGLPQNIPLVGRTYLDRKSIVVARKLATLEAKKTLEQKVKEVKQMEESKHWDG